jgi:HAE1 family hydrophobic/amphiphilic exporter-1
MLLSVVAVFLFKVVLFRFVIRWLLWLPIKINDWFLDGLHRSYPRALRWALGHRLLVYMMLALLIAGVGQLARTMPTELLPEVRQGEFTFEISLPVGTPLEETDSILDPIEKIILSEREHIRAVILTVGFDPKQSQRSDEGEHTARLKVLLDAAGRAGHEDVVAERMRRRFEKIPDFKARLTRPVLFSSKTPIEVEIHGDDLRELKEYGDRIAVMLSALPELSDVQSTLQSGAPEIQVVYDRERLTLYGLNIRAVAERVRDKVQGFEATRFNMLDRRIPIVARLVEDDRQTVEHVEGLVVNPGGDRPIILSSVAEVIIGEGPINGRVFEGRLIWRAGDGALSAGDYRGRIMLILEEIP